MSGGARLLVPYQLVVRLDDVGQLVGQIVLEEVGKILPEVFIYFGTEMLPYFIKYSVQILWRSPRNMWEKGEAEDIKVKILRGGIVSWQVMFKCYFIGNLEVRECTSTWRMGKCSETQVEAQTWFRAEPNITTAGLTAKGGTGRTVTTIQSGLEYLGSMPMM